jgi:hypothetical protein
VTAALKPLAELTVSIVGPGRVGTSFGCWLVQAGAQVLDVVGRDPARTAAAARLLGAAGRGLADGPIRGELVIVAVADGALREVAAGVRLESSRAVVVHTAGRYGASILAGIPEPAERGAWHPLRAFSRAELNLDAARGMLLAVDGGERVRELARRIAAACGWVVAEVPEAHRELYHLAATVAAGGAASMVAAARLFAARAGLGDAVARGYAELAASSIRAVADVAPATAASAITGPAARGEPSLSRRIAAAASIDSELGVVAALGALATILVRQGAGMTGPDDEALRQELDKMLGAGAFLDPPERR